MDYHKRQLTVNVRCVGRADCITCLMVNSLSPVQNRPTAEPTECLNPLSSSSAPDSAGSDPWLGC